MSSVYEDMTKAEEEVSGFLKQLGLWWKFEFPVFVYDEKDRPRVWTPDFYVPKLQMHIEVCGAERDYDYRRKIFRKNGLNVIFVHTYKKKELWKNHLIDEVLRTEEERHAEVMKVIRSLRSIR